MNNFHGWISMTVKGKQWLVYKAAMFIWEAIDQISTTTISVTKANDDNDNMRTRFLFLATALHVHTVLGSKNFIDGVSHT